MLGRSPEVSQAALLSSAEIINQFDRYVIANYRRYPVCLVRGEGSLVWDAEGRRYVDFFPGWGCNLVGHCPPRVVEAVTGTLRMDMEVPSGIDGCLESLARHPQKP